MTTSNCPVGCTGTILSHARFFTSFRKHRLFIVLFGLVIATALVSCSGEQNPDPKESEEELDPGTKPGTNNLVNYDAAFSVYEGKASLSAMTPEGKVVIWGSSKKTEVPIFRVTKDGEHDAGFDISKDKGWIIRKAQALAVQPDGRVILAGEFLVNGKTCSIIRLTSSGLLDNSFTPYDATQLTSYTITIANLLVQSDGKIVFSLSMFNSSLSLRYNGLYRLNSNGTKDTAFFVEGAWIKSTSDVNRIIGSNQINDIIQLADGKLLVCGGVKFFNKRRYVARINRDGSLDESFDFKERIDVIKSNFGDPLCLAEQNGKILVGGSFDLLVSESQRDTLYPFLNLMRLNGDGSIDQTLGTNTVKNFPVALIVREDNSFATISNAAFDDTHISLYTNNGIVRASYAIADSKSVLINLFRQSDNRFLVTGNILNAGESSAIARFTIK